MPTATAAISSNSTLTSRPATYTGFECTRRPGALREPNASRIGGIVRYSGMNASRTITRREPVPRMPIVSQSSTIVKSLRSTMPTRGSSPVSETTLMPPMTCVAMSQPET